MRRGASYTRQDLQIMRIGLHSYPSGTWYLYFVMYVTLEYLEAGNKQQSDDAIIYIKFTFKASEEFNKLHW